MCLQLDLHGQCEFGSMLIPYWPKKKLALLELLKCFAVRQHNTLLLLQDRYLVLTTIHKKELVTLSDFTLVS